MVPDAISRIWRAPLAAISLGTPWRGVQQSRRRQLEALARTHALHGDWLHYRATRLRLADVYTGDRDGLDALDAYLQIWYIDLNGPRNCGGLSGAWLTTEDPPFDPARGRTHPELLRRVVELSARLALPVEDARGLFLDAANATRRELGLPLTPTQAWLTMGTALLACVRPRRHAR